MALGAAGAERGSGETRRLDGAGCFRRPPAGVDAIEPADADWVSGRVRGWYEVCGTAETVPAVRRGIGGTAGASSSSGVLDPDDPDPEAEGTVSGDVTRP